MKKRILIVIYALLLCVTASFAWLSDFQEERVGSISVDFQHGALTVVNVDFDAFLETRDANGNFVPLGENEKFIFDKKNMVPDAMTPFKIKIKNNSTTESRKAKLGVAISIDPVEEGEVNILDMLYLDIVAVSGFRTTDTYHVYVRLSEADEIGADGSGTYYLTIYGDGSELIIPPFIEDENPENDYAVLDCSIYFDQEATAEYQNKIINTMVFRLE